MSSKILLDAMLSNLRDRPFDLEFAVTYKCNARCVQCSIWQYYKNNPKKAEKELKLEEIRKIFLSYKNFTVIGITGGEPFLRDDLPQIVDVLSETQRDLRALFISTNGQLPQLTVKRVSEILENRDAQGHNFRLTQLVSLDGPKDIHDHIRGIVGAYHRAVKTIKQLSRLKSSYEHFEIGTISVYSPFNFDRFNEVIEEIARLREEYDLEPGICVWFEGQLYKNIGQHQDERVELFKENLNEFIPKIKKIIGKKGSRLANSRCIFYDLLPSWLRDPKSQVVPCGAARIRYFLDPYGNVFPCVIFNKIIGNLRNFDYDFVKLLQSDSRKRVRCLVKNEECPVCVLTCETIPSIMAHPLHAIAKWVKLKLTKNLKRRASWE